MDTPFLYPVGMDMGHFVTALVNAPAQAPLSNDVVLEDYGQSAVYRGRPAVVSVMQAFFGLGFSNGRILIQETFMNEGSRAAAFIFHGQQDGVFLGIPASGRQVSVPMILLVRLTGAQIHYLAWYYDAGTLLRQLGLSLPQGAGCVAGEKTG